MVLHNHSLDMMDIDELMVLLLNASLDEPVVADSSGSVGAEHADCDDDSAQIVIAQQQELQLIVRADDTLFSDLSTLIKPKSEKKIGRPPKETKEKPRNKEEGQQNKKPGNKWKS